MLVVAQVAPPVPFAVPLLFLERTGVRVIRPWTRTIAAIDLALFRARACWLEVQQSKILLDPRVFRTRVLALRTNDAKRIEQKYRQLTRLMLPEERRQIDAAHLFCTGYADGRCGRVNGAIFRRLVAAAHARGAQRLADIAEGRAPRFATRNAAKQFLLDVPTSAGQKICVRFFHFLLRVTQEERAEFQRILHMICRA